MKRISARVAVTPGEIALQRRSAVNTAISSWPRSLSTSEGAKESESTAHVLRRAASEPGGPIADPLRSSLDFNLRHDFSQVKVHGGQASADAAERLGANAYTLGNDIHLGAGARQLSLPVFDRLLTHEVVHTVQQGGQTVAPRADMTVSHPADASEHEAEQIATVLSSRRDAASSSPSLAMRDRLRASMPAPQIARSVSPHIQRDITGPFKTAGGTFNVNLKTESHPAGSSGVSGTIKFTASDTAPDSTSIRLLQTVKDLDLSTGKDNVWTGGEANRNKMMTTEDKASGVEGGWFVDHSAAAAKQRTAKKDPAVSPYYRDYWPNASSSQDGSKKGKTVVDASLWDSPSSAGKREFSFETAAKATDTGHVYGTLMWGFALTDPAKGKVERERAVGRDVTLRTSDKALEKFNEFYKNPGASTAP
jgi:hypothetical protein